MGDGHQGSSGIFTIDPVDSTEVAVVGSAGTPDVVSLPLQTLDDPESAAFQTWHDSPGYDINAWSACRQ